jgi:hypothetical protein
MATKTLPQPKQLRLIRNNRVEAVMNVISIEEWLRRKAEKEWLRRKATGLRCWYPSRQNEEGEWELEPVYGVGEPICVYRERTE